MPRLSRNALSAAMVRSAGPGNYVDGNGLMLRVRKSGTRQWIQRLMIHGRRVDLGLGSAELVKLADARKVAADNRAIARTGGDPRRSRVPTFEKAEKICFSEKRDTWRSKSPANNWRSAVDRYVLPKIGGMPVDKVGSAAVYEVLRPIALAGKHATVKVAGAAITAVLEWARISEFRSEGSPVETVRRQLPKRAGGPKHHDAVHFSEVGNALARIDAGQCRPSTKLAMRFTALTAARQVEVRRATWYQFDLEAAVWTKPAEATKTAKSHRVPLSRQALDVLADARKATRGALVFPGSRPGAMMGNSVMTNALRTAGSQRPATGFGRASRTGRATTTSTSCSRSSHWPTSRVRRRWPPTPATTCWRSGARSCSGGPTALRDSAGFQTGTPTRRCRSRVSRKGRWSSWSC